MKGPLWLDITGTGPSVAVALSTCRNCGKVKVASDPCGFDHAAALMEFGAFTSRERPSQDHAATQGNAEETEL